MGLPMGLPMGLACKYNFGCQSNSILDYIDHKGVLRVKGKSTIVKDVGQQTQELSCEIWMANYTTASRSLHRQGSQTRGPPWRFPWTNLFFSIGNDWLGGRTFERGLPLREGREDTDVPARVEGCHPKNALTSFHGNKRGAAWMDMVGLL